MPGPLNGVRVVEVANWTFVPAAGAVLADLGADVIKVEPPNGDPQRALLNMLNLGGGGPNPFIEIPNRGKRSVTCDLTTDAGRQALARHPRHGRRLRHLEPGPDPQEAAHRCRRCAGGQSRHHLRARDRAGATRGPWPDVGGYDMACGWASSGMAFKMTQGRDRAPAATSGVLRPPGRQHHRRRHRLRAVQAGQHRRDLRRRRLAHARGHVGAVARHRRVRRTSGDVASATATARQVAQPARQRLRHQGRSLGLLRLPAARPLLGRSSARCSAAPI